MFAEQHAERLVRPASGVVGLAIAFVVASGGVGCEGRTPAAPADAAQPDARPGGDAGGRRCDRCVRTLAGVRGGGFKDGPWDVAQFSTPKGVAVVASGASVYVADAGNGRIRLVAGGWVTTVAGSGSAGSRDGPALEATLGWVGDVAVSASGRVYFTQAGSDGYDLVRILHQGRVATIAGGKEGFSDGPAASARFRDPGGIAVDGAGRIFVADTSNGRIRVIERGVVRTLAVVGRPRGVAVSPDGRRVYATDSAGHRLVMVAGGRVTTIAGSGQRGFADGPAARARFDAPFGIALGTDGDVFVADSNNARIRRIRRGMVATYAGTGRLGGRDGEALRATFMFPQGLAVDRDGRVYVADTQGSVIRVITPGSAD